MTLLDKFRPPLRQKHPDAAVRLAYVAELPLTEREQITTMARDDEDPRVRRAAVKKLLDPAALAAVAREDRDETVRADAVAMLRDIALDAFEDVSEEESLAAVAVLEDPKALAHVARTSLREEIGRSALARISDLHVVASVARQAALETIRHSALEQPLERADLLSVAIGCEHRNTALLALDRLTDRSDLEQVALRAKNKSALKRARATIQELDNRAAAEAAAALPAAEPAAASEPERLAASAPLDSAEMSGGLSPAAVEATAGSDAEPPVTPAQEPGHAEEPAALERERIEADDVRRREEHERAADARRMRLAELAAEAEAAATDPELSSARRRIGLAEREWTDVAAGIDIDPELAARLGSARERIAARAAEAAEAAARVRRQNLNRLQQLLGRAEPLVDRPDLSLKAADRVLRDIRQALADVPPLPSRQDYETVVARFKAVQTALTPKVHELREAMEWRRWANLGVQEQLCQEIESLRGLEDADDLARRIRDLQQQWRQAADVPRAQGELLWRRFKAVHDELWTRCEAHFAAQAETRAANLAKKIALCERVESIADSTDWLKTADTIKQLQVEWKTIGGVTRGQEKTVWERFRSACDRFFTRRHDDLQKRKATWAENLARKEALCVRAEALADSTDWDDASAELRRLQSEWKTIGPVKKSRSEAIWQRFRSACDAFFTRYAQRHDLARAERVAAREGICAELEALADNGSDESRPADLVDRVQALRSRWHRELATRAIDRQTATALDDRFRAAFNRVVTARAEAFAGTELDLETNRRKMEALVVRVEGLATSLAGSSPTASDDVLSPTTRLAAMLKEALAANTIGGKVDLDSRRRAAQEEVKQAQASWSRVGPVPDDARRVLTDRFQRALRRIADVTPRAETHGGSLARR